MKQIEHTLTDAFVKAFKALYSQSPDESQIQIQRTRKEFEGDFTVNVFPFLRISQEKPEQTAGAVGKYLVENVDTVAEFNVIKGFLNLSLSGSCWMDTLREMLLGRKEFGRSEPTGDTVLVEYSSPNTNKPLHLGHLRNIFLGDSVSRILKACGKNVVRTQIINDRGIHICKSMVARQQFGPDDTPQSTGKKGDQLVGEFYVLFDKTYKKQIAELKENGMTEEEAKESAPIMKEARETLKKWESGDKETIELWKMMNNWVYAGFDKTYESINVSFDKLYYESETYLKGREVVRKGLEKGLFFKKENGSIWVDLTEEGLDEKLLLRADGTAVYITQDIGTAIQRYEDFPDMKSMVYTVGNEQDYHFQVLFHTLRKLGHNWADNCRHLSYGMVELPEGKMKSREGTVVDADDLINDMIKNAEEQGIDRGSYDEMKPQDRKELAAKVGIAALKYFILKVDPKKNMVFNPKESIDLNGDTGPFIQYTYARTASIMRKSGQVIVKYLEVAKETLPNEDREIVKILSQYPEVVAEAGEKYSPGVIARYCFELAKAYNSFYQNTPIYRAEVKELVAQRVMMTSLVQDVLKRGMDLLGIEMPERF